MPAWRKATVFFTAFVNADGSLTLGHFSAFFAQPLMRESFFNSLYVALLSTLFAALIAVPLAYFTVRFEFRGALLIQTLGVLPLIMPPFVGAVAMQLLFGRNGTVNLFVLERYTGDGLVCLGRIHPDQRPMALDPRTPEPLLVPTADPHHEQRLLHGAPRHHHLARDPARTGRHLE